MARARIVDVAWIRERRPGLAAAAAAVLLAGLEAGCGGRLTPLPLSQCSPTTAQRVGSIYRVEASPAESDVAGLLTAGKQPIAGRPFPVRWLVLEMKAADQLTVEAEREGTHQVVVQTVNARGRVGDEVQFPSTITFPTWGCWNLDLTSGTADGVVVFKVPQ
jgi:hypothetical protein